MESKIGCVNHDCEKCKAQQYQAAHCKLGPNFCKECAVEQKKTVAAIMYRDHLEKPWVHVIQDDLPSGTKLIATPQPPAQQQEPVNVSDELLLIESVLKGYPSGFAQRKALRAVKVLLAAAPQPAQRTWVGLTDEDIDALREANSEGRGAGWRFNFKGFARAIEAKLKEKNNG